MFSWQYNILRTLLRHKAGPLQDTIKIVLGSTMLLALRRSLGHQFLGIQLYPMRLDAGKGHTRTFNTDRPLHGFEPRTGTHKPLHKSEVAARYRISRPQPAIMSFMASSANLCSSTNCFSWSLKGTGCSDPRYWDQNSFSVDIPSSAL